jgi:hypothetical protein
MRKKLNMYPNCGYKKITATDYTPLSNGENDMMPNNKYVSTSFKKFKGYDIVYTVRYNNIKS